MVQIVVQVDSLTATDMGGGGELSILVCADTGWTPSKLIIINCCTPTVIKGNYNE